MTRIVRKVAQALGARQRNKSVPADDWISDSAIDRVEDDRLGHRYLIGPLAELLASGPSVGNVGVFGPWGSGKTSIGRLLRARLEAFEDLTIKFVYFDAWKYQETPLRREFLRAATEQLNAKKTAKAFAERFYKKSRTTDLDLTDTSWVSIVGVVLAGLLAATAIYVGVSLAAAAIAFAGGQDFGPALVDQLTTNASTVLVSTAILVPLLSLVLNRWQTSWEESEPSSAEQFDKAFRDLVDEALESSDRVVFFIDELDRAPAQAVVGTLETMKTFLGVEGCVFVVAADQLVLEAAVKERSSAVRSPDPRNPYYSTGSAYLDKIFGFRLNIPPLPSSRLSPFAKELVVSRTGTWTEIAAHLDDVLSLLVPFHVASPRRVKVLLNNFVIAYRSIASNPDLKLRLADREVLVGLAKLVCLRTEFPLFYRSIEANPRLLRAVTEALDDREAAAAGYADDPDLWSSVVSVLDPRTAADVMLGDRELGGEASHTEALSDQLHDYLRLSSEVVTFDPEIFYLEPRGKAAGLSNQQAHEIRAAAFRGDISGTEKALASQGEDAVAAGFRYLASLLGEAMGAERQLLLQVVLRTSRTLSPNPVRAAAIAVLDHMEAARASALLGAADFDSYLRIVELGPTSRRERGETAVLRLAAENPVGANAAFRSLERLTDQGQRAVQRLATDLANQGLDLLEAALDALPADVVDAVLRGSTATVVAEKLRGDDELATGLVSALASKVSASTAWTIITPTLASATEERFETLEAVLDEVPVAPPTVPPVNALLRAISVDPGRRLLYSRHLPAAKPARPVDRARVAGAISAAISAAALSEKDAQVSRVVVEAVLRMLGADEGILEAQLATTLKELSTPYGPEEVEARRRQHSVLRVLASKDPAGPSRWLRILADSGAALLMTGQPIAEEGRQLFSSVVSLITQPPEDQIALQHLEQALKNERAAAAAGVFSPARRRFELSQVQRSLIRNGWALDSDANDTVNAARLGGTALDGGTVAVMTDALRPSFKERPKLIRQAIHRAQIDDWDAQQLEPYFRSLSEEEAAEQMGHCLETRMPAPTRVLEWLRPTLDETQWTRHLASKVVSSTRNGDRNLALSYLAEVFPEKQANRRRMADALLSIADRGEGSFKIAARWGAEMLRREQLGTFGTKTAAKLLKVREQKYPHLKLPARTEATLAQSVA